MNFVDYPDDELMAVHLANTMAGELTAALEHKDRVLFVVPGGTTPGPVFDSLCDADLDWARVDVLPSDERWLPEVHVRSNSRLIRERLLTGRAARANFLPLYRQSETPEPVLEELEAAISPALPINVCLLGMGADMHTASLFPGADNLEKALDRYAPVLVPMRAEDVPEPRVTLSARVLRDALALHVVITGQAKKAALDRARSLDPAQAPVAAVLEEATVHWAP
ncbi:MAG: 6-phosphogluconolactonase [Roseovarius sp.]|uniref:6-phosphogluconolactonase n=1 Tax=Alphaproteobacteria TaxID=28211 RepID=UPI0032EB8753